MKGGDDIMFEEVYDWLEQWSGSPYDLTEEIELVSSDMAFTEPYCWKLTIGLIIDNLAEAIDIINTYGDNLPEELPSKGELVKVLTAYVLCELIDVVNHVKQQMNISNTDIKSVNDLYNNVTVLTDLIDMLTEHDMDEIIKDNLFEKYNEENDDMFTEVLDIYKNDLTNIHFAIDSIRENYSDSNDDE